MPITEGLVSADALPHARIAQVRIEQVIEVAIHPPERQTADGAALVGKRFPQAVIQRMLAHGLVMSTHQEKAPTNACCLVEAIVGNPTVVAHPYGARR